jgi:hypothetical protein
MGTTPRHSKTKSASATRGGRNLTGWPIYGWHVVTFLVGMLLAAGLQWMFRPGDRGARTMPGATHGMGVPSMTTEVTGPWGRLQVTPMVLDRPDELFELQPGPVPPIRWSFPNHTLPQLVAFLDSCDLTASQRAALLDTNRWQPGPTGWRVWPPKEVVRGLREPARARIYEVLAQSPENPQRHPFLCREDHFEEMFEGCGLPLEKVGLVRELCYRRGELLQFADSQLFELMASSNETRCLFKTLLRVPTMLVTLHVTADADIDALTAYWDAGGREKDLRPLLQSLARMPGGGSINISFFLPPGPRELLYTYPRSPESLQRDCYWSSFNFFGERPGYRLGDVAYAGQLLETDYVRVTGEKRFGDLLMLLENGYAQHACIYVAGDIYFTKNGTDPRQPWVLMSMRDMMTQYQSGQPQEWRVYRRRTR